MARPRIAIVSPDPDERAQGLEKFCHMLDRALVSRGFESCVIGVGDAHGPFDMVVTNGIFGPYRSKAPRLHVYHGTAPRQLAIEDPSISRRWRAKSVVEKTIREFRAGWGATRVAVSPSVRRELRQCYRFSSEVVLNGVDTDIFSLRDRLRSRELLGLDSRERYALFVGRPEARKLPDYALAAARATGHRLLLAAGRPYEGMEWIGRLDEERLTMAISAVDVVYLPSQYEAMALAVLEVLAVGTPLITSRVGWVPDLIEAVPAFAPFAPSPARKDWFVEAAMLQARAPGDAIDATRAASEYVRRTLNLDCFADAWAALVARSLQRHSH